MIRSRRWQRWLPSSAALALGAGSLAVLLAAGAAPDVPDPGGLSAARPAGVDAAPPGVAPRPAVPESAILDRPLFSATRRPPPAPAPAPEAAAPPASPPPPPPPELGIALVGIVLDGTARIAILRPLDGQPALDLREGEAVGGWRVIRIGSDRIAVRNGDTERELVIDFKRGAAAP
jgi:general secretion pathway protein N